MVKNKARHYQPSYNEAKLDYENHIAAHIRETLQKYGLEISNVKCLDVGCGASSVIHELSANKNRYVGLDSDLVPLKIAKRVSEHYDLGVDFVCGDAQELPEPSEITQHSYGIDCCHPREFSSITRNPTPILFLPFLKSIKSLCSEFVFAV